ncbi:MAG: hypothetical protein ACE5GO_03490 [Anaerolineales bacterium]
MKFAAYFVFIILLSLPLTSCAGTQAGAAETWAMVELLTVGERTDRALETVEVRNCGVVEQKTTSCSAGTSNDLSVSLGGSVGVSAVGVGDISGEVSTDLGVGRDSGQSLELETPPEGYVFHYTINTEYHVKAGEVLARSSSGEEQTLSYTFHASCALRIEMRETLSCEAPPRPPPAAPPPPRLPSGRCGVPARFPLLPRAGPPGEARPPRRGSAVPPSRDHRAGHTRAEPPTSPLPPRGPRSRTPCA